MTPLVASSTPEPVRALCKRLHVKTTHGRRLIMALLAQSDRPLDAEAIGRWLDGTPHRLHRATLYRALRYLEEKGALVAYSVGRRRMFQCPDGPAFVQVIDPVTQEPLNDDLGEFPHALRAWVRGQGFELRGYVELQRAPLSSGAVQPLPRSLP